MQVQTHEEARESSIGNLIGLEQLLEKSEPEADDQDSSLDETAQDERAYVRGRLKEDLGREPTEQEIDDWLRQHTEGY